MRFRQIEIFHAVYTNGSISAAARALGVSQPSVSKMLRHAEDQLGFKLFQLVRGWLVPTDEAHALFREAGDVFDRLSSLQQTAKNLRNLGGGHIRLAIVPSLALAVAPQAIARFRRDHPMPPAVAAGLKTRGIEVRAAAVRILDSTGWLFAPLGSTAPLTHAAMASRAQTR